jgi:hypothetical protein
MDDLDTLDREPSNEIRTRLREACRLAPEHLSPEVVKHLIGCVHGEEWEAGTLLSMLHRAAADPTVMAHLALRRFSIAPREAAEVLLSRIAVVDPGGIPPALPSIVYLAAPDYRGFPGASPEPEPNLLLALWKQHPSGVVDGLKRLLSSRNARLLRAAGSALDVITEVDPAAALPFVLDITAKLARSTMLVDDLDEYEGLDPLPKVLAEAFAHAPQEVERILANFAAEPVEEARKAVFTAYRDVLRLVAIGERTVQAEALRLALTRLLWAAPRDDGVDAAEAALEAMRGDPASFGDLAANLFDDLLGVLLLLDDRLGRLHAEGEVAEGPENFLRALERNNKRSSVRYLMSSVVRWAAHGTRDDSGKLARFMQVLGNLPEDRHDLRGLLLRSAQHLAATVTGLNAILPHLFSGLVGTSVLVRAEALVAIRELSSRSRQSLPSIVFETVVYMLADPYVMVHQNAVETLSRIQEPDEFRHRIILNLFQLIHVYRGKKNKEDFLLECIELLSGYLRRDGGPTPKAAEHLLTILAETDGERLRRNLRWIARIFHDHASVVDVVVKAMASAHRTDHGWDDLMFAVEALSDGVVRARKDEIARLGAEMMVEHPRLALQIIEVLWKVEAWSYATAVAAAGVERLPDNVRNRWRRTYAQLHRTAAAFEEAVAAGRLEALEDLEREWHRAVKVMQELRVDAKERDSRGLFPRPG